MSTTWGQYSGEIKGVKFEHDHAHPESENPPYYAPAEQDFINAMQGIANRYGKLSDKDVNGIYVGYTNQKDNDAYKIGVHCSNCGHYESENVCKIIKTKIEPGGKCRLAAIPSSAIKTDKKKGRLNER